MKAPWSQTQVITSSLWYLSGKPPRLSIDYDSITNRRTSPKERVVTTLSHYLWVVVSERLLYMCRSWNTDYHTHYNTISKDVAPYGVVTALSHYLKAMICGCLHPHRCKRGLCLMPKNKVVTSPSHYLKLVIFGYRGEIPKHWAFPNLGCLTTVMVANSSRYLKFTV